MDPPALQFRVWGEVVPVNAGKMPALIRLDEILPVLREVDDRLIELAANKDGRPISCAKGCSACCRVQPVPVTPAEAYALLLLVEGLPEPRRSTVISRFADCAARLEQAGLAEIYLEGRQAASDQEARSYAERYLELRLACPFLEEDACSIYADRPFVCREYQVTSPPEFCADPLTLPVTPVANVLSPVRAILQVTAALNPERSYTIPLTLALVYALSHRDTLERTYSAAEVLGQSIRSLLLSGYAAFEGPA